MSPIDRNSTSHSLLMPEKARMESINEASAHLQEVNLLINEVFEIQKRKLPNGSYSPIDANRLKQIDELNKQIPAPPTETSRLLEAPKGKNCCCIIL